LETLLEILQRRWLLLLSIFMFLLATMPGPVPHLIVDPIHQTETAAASGHIEAALDHLQKALTIQPQLRSLSLEGAQLALLINQPQQAKAYLADLPQEIRMTNEANCLEDRTNLQFLEAPVGGWDGLLERCPAARTDLERFAAQYDDGSSYENLQYVLSAVEAAGLSTGEWQRKQAFLQSIVDPEQAVDKLREIILRDEAGADQALELLDILDSEENASEPAYALAQIGQIFARSGEWRFAALAFQQAVTLDPDYTEARAYLGLAREQQGLDGLAELNQAAQAAPNAALPHVFLGEHYLASGNLVRAIRELEIATSLDAGNPGIAAELASIYAANGSLDLAEAAYLRATQLAPTDSRFWRLLAQFSLAYEVKISELGIPAARNAVTLSKNDPVALDTLGYAHLLQGDLLLAERLLLRAVRLQPGRAQTQYHLGLLRIHQGDAQSGLAAFRAAEQLDPDSSAGDLAQRGIENVLR
jgi:tetratricopeptide (TPR) repeat protein